jgi:hypothetical protein
VLAKHTTPSSNQNDMYVKTKAKHQNLQPNPSMGRRGRYRMVVGFTTTCAISAYQH